MFQITKVYKIDEKQWRYALVEQLISTTHYGFCSSYYNVSDRCTAVDALGVYLFCSNREKEFWEFYTCSR